MASIATQLKAWKGLKRKQLQAAAARALNRAATTVRAEATKRAREDLNLKAADVKATMTVKKADRKAALSKMVAFVITEVKAVPLFKFGASPKKVKTKAGVRIGVTVKVKKKGQRKMVAGAFIAKMKNGHTGVFWRGSKSSYDKDGKRLPIRQRFSTTVADLFKGKEFVKNLQRVARAAFKKNLEHELKHELGKQKR